jgi:ATP-dependent Clp protease ATP-binding subunit ClpA
LQDPVRGIRERYEEHSTRYAYTDEAMEAAAKLYTSSRYIPDRYLPDKAIDVMDEAGKPACKLRQTTVLARGQAEVQVRIEEVRRPAHGERQRSGIRSSREAARLFGTRKNG